ncbi:MAG: hypothetical protein QNJ53_24430 [Pleurocapsa sp. MO_192.B19]|nr:hypothetical protein [Pleurocapsa sp. MO_192.B19]
MTPEEFSRARISDLAKKTNINKFQWCRYLNGKVFPRYSTLRNAATDLDMKVSTLVECIEKRVQKKNQKASCA